MSKKDLFLKYILLTCFQQCSYPEKNPNDRFIWLPVAKTSGNVTKRYVDTSLKPSLVCKQSYLGHVDGL